MPAHARVRNGTYRGVPLLRGGRGDAAHVVDDGGEVCGAVELDLGQGHAIGLDNPLHPWGHEHTLPSPHIHGGCKASSLFRRVDNTMTNKGR